MENQSKQDILDAACELFAQKGYKNTTVREICKKANSYQISINYYFGGKDNLYKEAVLNSYQYTDEYNLYEKVKGLSFEDKIKTIITSRINSLFSNEKNSYFFRILSHMECKDDVLLEDVFEKTFRIYVKDLVRILEEEFGAKLNEFDKKFIVFSLMVQGFQIKKVNRPRMFLFGTDTPSKQQLEEFIEANSTTVLAAINEFKNKYQGVKQ